MKTIVFEDFKDLELNEFPYDRAHTALGEYHHRRYQGTYGAWYDPIPLHQWRSMDGSWLVTSDGKERFLEQNRGNHTKDAFRNVYCCLVHQQRFYRPFRLSFSLRLFEVAEYCGMAVNYVTSRCYDAIAIKGGILSLYHRQEETFQILASACFDFSDLKTYRIRLEWDRELVVYLNDVRMFSYPLLLVSGSRMACVAKSACRFGKIEVVMTDEQAALQQECELEEEVCLRAKRSEYPPLVCIHRIDLKNFGSGRQLRIAMVEGKPIFLLAQHQKRMIRDSFARLSCLTVFDFHGTVLWQVGEPHNIEDNTLISCDLPFQVGDMNQDGRKEVIYAMDFEVIIADLLTGKVLKRMPTPIVSEDPLVQNEPFYRLNVDAIRFADFEGLGYKGGFILKDRYQNVWAYNHKMENIWRYHHKNTGHFPYIADFDEDGKDEMFVGYDLVDHDGTILSSLPMNSDHTDEIIYARLKKDQPKRLILASGNEGMNIVDLNGTIICHNEIGHAQRISVAKYDPSLEGLQIMATAFWGSDGIICLYDADGQFLRQIEQRSNGNLISPVSYDGTHVLSLLHAGVDGGLIDGQLDKVVLFPDDGHPTLCCEVYDIDEDGIDEIICFDLHQMWIYKAQTTVKGEDYIKYPEDAFSNYRGEFLLPKEYA